MKSNLLPVATLLCALQMLATGCAHKKGPEPVTRENLQKKRVAVAEITGAPESVKHVEVAIVNEIADAARFTLVDRFTVQEARSDYPTEADFERLGKKVGADYVLAVAIKDFEVKERRGYDKVEEHDSLLTEEAGSSEPVKGTRYVKVKRFEGTVRLACKFFDVEHGKMTYEGVGFANEIRNSRDKNFPRKLQFLEELSAKALRNFFERLPRS